MIHYLEVDDLVEIASIVLGGTPQVRDFGLLSSAVVRPATVAFGQEAYPDLWTKAAALLHSVCMNHALIDGNKRLAWAAGRVFLALNEVPIQDVDVDQAEALVMSVASGTLTEVSDIARELRKLYV
ncbi:type II toxin-antitoxin system death-on-curing family toxin [Micromonospora chalcea]|uniref:type II toxin-antitoxin system death-on-curing family toxin n=1 Tax=Micromonospora TaxID=1873 RepID=UPI000E303EC6|nr:MULTISPECIES: Fic family protein [Micromonospora]MBF5028258.1 Fic family protein [Micromonospora sp. ANENR4]AXO33239.1 death on curing protein Doc toxin [Micromonospora sp. B006]MCZ7425692.1 Fic family protein [Micromonospora sp. WMMA1949]MCZ7473271.1 Fic family protein [Micromonospora sp. WMMC273]WBC10241.1 Fic family protein [Micromonospora sp. WMMA1947]